MPEFILEVSLLFICFSGLSSNPPFQRTGETPMHFHNEDRDIVVLTQKTLIECVCVFVFKQSFSGCTLKWGFSAVHPLVLMLPSQPGLFLCLFACIHPLVPSDIQTLHGLSACWLKQDQCHLLTLSLFHWLNLGLQSVLSS